MEELSRIIAQNKPWYRRAWGEALIVAGAVAVFGALVLGAQVFRIARALQKGDAAALEQLVGSGKVSGQAAQGASQTVDGLAEGDFPSLGNKNAPITVVTFSDFGCPYSRDAAAMFRELATRFPQSFRYVYRNFPITDLHPGADKAAQAALCAQEQGKFWPLHDKLWYHLGTFTDESLARAAAGTGMDMVAYTECMTSNRTAQKVKADFEAGLAAQVQGTPTLFINGHRVQGAPPQATLEELFVQYGLDQ